MTSPEAQHKYRQILKTVSLFGGVQMLNIIFSIVRSKAAAYFLGPAGIGIIGLFNSAIDFISQITKLGIDVTAVKEISYANHKGDSKKLTLVFYLVKRLVWFTGLLGSLILCGFSSFISELTFGDTSYQWAFILMSLVILLRQITTGNLAITQGLKKYKLLARINVLIAVLTTGITVFLYWLLGIDSIVYVIIASAISGVLISTIYTYSLIEKNNKYKLTVLSFIGESKKMIVMGFNLSLVGIMSLASVYLFKIYLRQVSGMTDVGYYQASFIIINTYVALVFNALRTDYFPRLSAVHDNLLELRILVNQQAKLTTLIITPIVSFFIVFVRLVVKVLYSNDFLVITDLLEWAMLGVLLRSASFTLGYVLLAKNDSSVFLKTTVFFNILLLLMSVLGYKLFGLEGVGIAYFIYYLCHLLGLILISKFRYTLNFNIKYYRTLGVCFILVLSLRLINFLDNDTIKYLSSFLLLCLTCIYTYVEINQLVNLKSLINKLIGKK